MGVNLVQVPDGSAGMQGKALDTGPFIFINIPYNSASPLVMSGCVASRDLVVRYINVTPDVASTNAVTVTAYSAGNGTAIGSGTALHTGSGNLQGAANTSQVLAVNTPAPQVSAGSRIGVVISGALGAAGSGLVSIACNPL